jgi:murein DD-endopeptidase MepM/ murein hydrolase activator NlpD
MRFLGGLLLGIIIGASAQFFGMRWYAAPAAAIPKRPPPVSPAVSADPEPASASQTPAPALAAPLSPDSPIEDPMSEEPSRKETPPLNELPALTAEAIVIPVVGARREDLRDMFRERRGSREHQAIDIAAPRGTPVLAAIDGPVAKLFLSRPGGMTVYQYDPSKSFIYYYAHLDGYAPGLVEGQMLRRGDVIGYVGTSGNSPPNAPHLHFSIERVTEPGKWWKSEAVDPYPILTSRGVTVHRSAERGESED